MPDPDHYKVNWANVDNGSAAIGAAVATMDARLAEMNQRVEQLVAGWDSNAASEYRVRQQEWNGAADSIKDALAKFQAGVKAAGEAAAAAEAQAVGTIGGGRA